MNCSARRMFGIEQKQSDRLDGIGQKEMVRVSGVRENV